MPLNGRDRETILQVKLTRGVWAFLFVLIAGCQEVAAPGRRRRLRNGRPGAID